MANWEFSSKVVLVTGSSSGIGAQIAQDFAKAGARVIVTGRRWEAIQKVVEECNILSPNSVENEAFGIAADITKIDKIKNLVGTVLERFGRLDILINCAGGGTFDGIHDDQLVKKIEKMMNLNLRSVVAFTQAALPHLEASKGNIVNIVSQYATRPVSSNNNHDFFENTEKKCKQSMF